MALGSDVDPTVVIEVLLAVIRSPSSSPATCRANPRTSGYPTSQLFSPATTCTKSSKGSNSDKTTRDLSDSVITDEG